MSSSSRLMLWYLGGAHGSVLRCVEDHGDGLSLDTGHATHDHKGDLAAIGVPDALQHLVVASAGTVRAGAVGDGGLSVLAGDNLGDDKECLVDGARFGVCPFSITTASE